MARTKAEIDLLREGFVNGRTEFCATERGRCNCGEKAAEAFPYPKVTRQRVAKLYHNEFLTCYTLRDGHVYFGYSTGRVQSKVYTEDQLAQLASLLPAERLRQIADSGKCGPTEEVEVE